MKDSSASSILGRQADIHYCHNADSSLEKVLKKISNPKVRVSVAAKVQTYLEMLGRGEIPKFPGSMRKEGKLPSGDAHFYALKVMNDSVNLRVYLFEYNNCWWISHAINKKKMDLDKSDTQKVSDNYRAIAGNC